MNWDRCFKILNIIFVVLFMIGWLLFISIFLYEIPDDIEVIREFMLVTVVSFLIFAVCEIIFWVIRWIIVRPQKVKY